MLLWIISSQLQVWEFRRWFCLFLFGFGFLTTFLPLQSCCYVYTYTQNLLFLWGYIRNIILHWKSVQYSSSVSSSGLVESCVEWHTLGRADNAPFQSSPDPQSDGVHPSVFIMGNSFVAVPCQLDLTSTYERGQHKPDSWAFKTSCWRQMAFSRSHTALLQRTKV